MQLKNFFIATLVLVASLCGGTAFAQQPQPLPVDPAVRMGTLPNGLTYIVRHNENPKNRANYYIAQKVGSILEDDSQRGLAHFLEHMAFNGTKNFPGKKLIGFLESIGCRFGADLNAYTAFDETVYTVMDAPTDRGNGVIDSCLLIMHDWSNCISLDPKEIEEERGVIHEEWRSRDNASLRNLTSMLPKILPNNKYANRMPIGTMEVVDNFKHKEIIDFYHKWYRPDLQGIIVVGDIDPDYVVKKLTELFSDIPAPKNPAERYQVKVAKNDKPIVAIATDKESTNTVVKAMYKHDPLPRELRGTVLGMVMGFTNNVISSVVDERFEEITRKANSPIIEGGVYDYNFAGIAATEKALHFIAVPKEGKLVEGTQLLAKEIHRLREFGVTQAEFDRARTNILKTYETLYNERKNTKNRAYCEEYKQYFLNGGYIPGIEVEKQVMDALAKQLTPEVINQYLKEVITDGKNLVITVEGPKKAGLTYPSENAFLAIYEKAFGEQVQAIKEKVLDTNLIDGNIKAGTIVSEKKNQKYGATELTLSNGVKVYLKKTDFKDDQILMSGVAHGGLRLYKSPADIKNSKIVNAAISVGGLGKFNAQDLSKVLTGRAVSVSSSVGQFTTHVNGSAVKKDFETMLQLTYLKFTALRQDNEAYKVFKNNTIEQLKNKNRNPLASVGDSVQTLLYGNNPITKSLTIEDMEKVSYTRALEIARERFANANGFEFFFVGSFDEEEVKPLIAKYLGGLHKGKATKKMDRTDFPSSREGKKTVQIVKDMNTPTALVFDILKGKTKYSQKQELVAQILNGVLDQTLVASIRERESGTYSPAAGAGVDEFPKQEANIFVQFFCAPERAEQLNKVVYDELDLIVKNGVNKEFFEKTVVNMKKRHGEVLRENSYWLGQLSSYFFEGKDWVGNYDKLLESVTPKDVQKLVEDIMTSGNRLQLYFRSSKTEADLKK